MTQADLGLADAYINGDFSFVDKDEGLLILILVSIPIRILQRVVSLRLYTLLPFTLAFLLQILIANRDSNASNSKLKKNR